MFESPADLQPPTERLDLLYRLNQAFTSTLDLNEVLNRVMDQVIQVIHAERGFVMLLEEDDQLVFQVARGMDKSTITKPVFQVSMSVVESVARNGEPVLTVDAQKDPRFGVKQSVKLLGLQSILCVPMKLKGRTLGVIYVENRIKTGLFTEEDLELLSSIASGAAIAIENARLYEVAIEKGRLESELQMARQLQEGLIQDEQPELAGWEFSTRWIPARQVAGDYYDFLRIADRKVGVVIADVSDKGVHAALFMALTRSIMRASLDGAASPKEGINRANRLICADAKGGMFVTLFYALVDSTRSQITYVNAGHNPPMILHRSSSGQKQLSQLGRTGMALGIKKENTYEQFSIKFFPGDFLVLYTDGVTDALNENNEEFGFERLEQIIISASDGTAEDMIKALENSLKEFSGDQMNVDDVTIVVAKRR